MQNFAYRTELTWWVFGLSGIIALAIAILTVSLRTWKAATRNPIDAFFLIGSVLAITGLIIRVTSILQLKQHFTYTVTKIKNHELIETGLYRIIRHPGYLGQLIIFLGISICLSNCLSILLMIIPVLLGYLNRINVEEKFMVVQLGQKYIDYRKRTKRLIPMIY